MATKKQDPYYRNTKTAVKRGQAPIPRPSTSKKRGF